ncbi:uncharacterized protein LOC111081237 [Drosophila obscura]|uniref:uncharacterized protein LOC111081237 n=1 Tax=Drosophila obscura TaxID=7282 RepID=UPI001BB1851B|nr:uncharacterized protein LOC111081237 [Drosophila obscura]
MGEKNQDSQLTDISNTYQNRSNHSDILNLLSKVLESQQATNKKIEKLIEKIDRQGAELISLRSEVSSIKARVCGEVNTLKLIVPISLLATMEGFEDEEHFFKNLVMNL